MVVKDNPVSDPAKGRLVTHSWMEFGVGIILGSRWKEVFDEDGGGLFVFQYQVQWPNGGRGWFNPVEGPCETPKGSAGVSSRPGLTTHERGHRERERACRS